MNGSRELMEEKRQLENEYREARVQIQKPLHEWLASPSFKTFGDIMNNLYINSMEALAKRWGWSAAKQARLHAALKKLDFDGDPNVKSDQIRQSWQDILTRGKATDFSREASNGEGPGFPGAERKTDTTIARCSP